MTMVELTCPNCRFSAKISDDKVPKGVKWVNCPRCRHRFELIHGTTTIHPNQALYRTNTRTFTGRAPSAWENRLELGLLQGMFKTFTAVLFSPEKFFRRITFRAGLKEPFAFGLLFGSMGSMFGLFWQFLLTSGKSPFYVQSLLEHFSLNLLFFGLMVISPLIVALMMFISGSIVHICLLVVRGGKNGFEGTFRVVAFSQATNILGIIPFLGGFIGSIWQLIVVIMGLREIHEISYVRVFLAVLLPVGLFFLFTIIAIIVLVSSLF